MLIPSAQVPPPPLPSAAGLHGPGWAQLPVTTRLRTVMFVHCGGRGGGGGDGGLPGLSQVLNTPVATHLAGTQDDRRQQPLSTPLLAEAFANITTQWHPFVASQRASQLGTVNVDVAGPWSMLTPPWPVQQLVRASSV
jgi:hypothetical protein